MIVYTSGDLLQSEAEALVNAVNCQGVMGKGLALQFKKAFPENYSAYAAACRHRSLRPGRMHVFERGLPDGPRYIVNFPTKDRWRNPSLMSYITTGLEALAWEIERREIRSIALPALGCGLGGLPWTGVMAAIESAMGRLGDVRVLVYQPG